jgi:hypothetical protein
MSAEFGRLFNDILFSGMVSIYIGYDLVLGKYPFMGQSKKC